ncbi:hypothetical protein CK203_104388 [Vitis vinifera]|uniref:DUF4283 domain-containing protein n=1 Tax=Vitis vinifera TaxID=29760 RepID=A0A438ECE4_VITVI|nr:hypothetical protein CK203_104388 [Vitis vinifera]
MEIEGEDICRNVDRLGQCLVGKWNPRVAGGEDLARMGWLMASVWGIKGKLGLAWMEEGQALLEFENAVEARKVFAVGKRMVGGIHVDLELWSPSFGCLEEGEIKEEVWVRIKGLPLSLWVPNILRRVGDECGGFVAMDTPTEKMENLRWARILVKTKRGELPSSIEIGIEEIVYNLPLWWEVLSSIRQKTEGRRGSTDRGRGEERGDGGARAGRRVEEWGSARLEALLRSDDGMEGQLDGMGRISSVGRIQFGLMIRSSAGGSEDGSSLDGLNEFNLALRRDGGPSPQNPSEVVMAKEAGGGGFGPMGRTKGPKGKEKALEEETGPRLGPFLDKSKSSGLSLSCLKDFGVQPGGPSVKKKKGSAENQPKKGPLEALAQSGLPGEANFELEFLSSREKEIESDQKANPHYVLADSALEEEALRYEAFSTLGGLWDSGNSSHSSLLSLGRTPEGEFFDHSGVLREACQNGNESNGQGAVGPRETGNICWDLVEFKGPISMARELEGGSSQFELQEERGEGDLDWQESSLARLSQFLGFSTDGLEKDILNFLVKIRKRREKIHSKGLLEKSRFERELKRLECSVNYKGDGRKKCPIQGIGVQAVIV